MGALKPWHILLLVVLLLLLFGAKKLPDGARALGRSLRIFKSETKGLLEDDKPKTPDAVPARPLSDDEPSPLHDDPRDAAYQRGREALREPVTEPTGQPVTPPPAPSLAKPDDRR